MRRGHAARPAPGRLGAAGAIVVVLLATTVAVGGPAAATASSATRRSVTVARPATAVDTDATWTITPNPSQTDPAANLAATTCVTASDCWAVGNGTHGAVALHGGGAGWSSVAVSMVDPGGHDQFKGVSCPSSGDCWAVGSTPTGTGTRSLIEHWDGHSWTASASLTPTGHYGQLNSVSCTDASDCMAVGYDQDLSAPPSNEAPAAARWDGHSWTQLGIPALNIEPTPLQSVSCDRATDCWAVGYGYPPTSNQSGVAEHWNGAVWTLSTISLDYGQPGVLNAVSCPSATDCWAVGTENQYPAVVHWDGTSWQWVFADQAGLDSAGFSGVSCLNVDDCWAVGDFGELDGSSIQTLTEHWDGTDWTAVASANTDAETWNLLNAVACTATSDCVAVGSLAEAGGLAERWDGAAGTQPYHPLTPYRVTDTRPDSGQANAGHTLGRGGVLEVTVAGTGTSDDAVPADATAAVLNVTAVNPSSASFLSVYPAGQSPPLASNLNVTTGQVVPNLVQVPLGAGGGVDVYNNTGAVDVVVDVEGFVGPAAPADSSGGGFVPWGPARLADTRAGSGQPDAGATLGPGGFLDVAAAGQTGIPTTGVSAVVVNVTAVDPSASTFLTVFPAGQGPPFASNLNVAAGQIVANRVIVPVGANGQIALYNAFGHTDVVVDVTGWYTDAGGPGGLAYTPTAPTRLCDTRGVQPGVDPNQCNHDGARPGTLGYGAIGNVVVAGEAGVPLNATAVVLNVTATNTNASSFLTVWRGQTPAPLASDVNWTPGRTVPNLVVVGIGDDGTINVRNAFGDTDVVIDVEGYYG